MPAISVIIPTYGMPQFLYKTIQSVLRQTFCDFEVLVVDDNDPASEARKATEILISSFDDERLYYLKHPHNLNGAMARNTGLAAATGKYIAFLDSDDEYMPERLQKCFEIMENASDGVGGVYTGCEFRRSGKVYHSHVEVKAGNYLIETLACSFMFCTGSNIFVKKSVIEKMNGFDSSFVRHQDYEFLVRFFESYLLEAIPEILVIKNNENVNLPKVENMIRIKKQYLEKYQAIINKCSKQEKDYIFRSHFMQIAEMAQRSRNYKLANEYYKKVKRYGRLTFKEQFRRLALVGRNIYEENSGRTS